MNRHEGSQYLRYDVVVVGAGPAGLTAAIAAAREGSSVLLVERSSQVGGMGTAGLVSHWLGGRCIDTSRWAVGGLFRTFCEETAQRGISVLPAASDHADVQYTPYGQYKGSLIAGVPFDPFAMAAYLERKINDAGVTLLLNVHAAAIEKRGDRVIAVTLAGKEGLFTVEAATFIDATGDADIAAMAGCPFVKGAEEDGYMTPASLIMHIENVDEDGLMSYVNSQDDPRFRKLMARIRTDGVDLFDYEIMIFVRLNRKGTFMVNGRKVSGIDGVDSFSRTKALVIEHERIQATLPVFRKYFPGMAHEEIKAVAADLGVRETRRINGE
ncbi:MAG: FAD-dependent oxidoreductase [Spirochaetota bacterium]